MKFKLLVLVVCCLCSAKYNTVWEFAKSEYHNCQVSDEAAQLNDEIKHHSRWYLSSCNKNGLLCIKHNCKSISIYPGNILPYIFVNSGECANQFSFRDQWLINKEANKALRILIANEAAK